MARVLQVKEDFDLATIDHPQAKFTKEKKIEAVTTYVLTGSTRRTAKSIGVPEGNICKWKDKAGWWPEAVATVRRSEQDKLDSVMTGVIDNIMGQLQDRLEHGDLKEDTKTGEWRRVPMKAKDLSVIGAITFDKRQLIRGDATAITSRSRNSLKDIETKMMDWAEKLQSEKVINSPKSLEMAEGLGHKDV